MRDYVQQVRYGGGDWNDIVSFEPRKEDTIIHYVTPDGTKSSWFFPDTVLEIRTLILKEEEVVVATKKVIKKTFDGVVV